MNFEKFLTNISMQISGVHLMAVHGACCLALRHPDWNGESRKYVLEFVAAAEASLKEKGILTEKDIVYLHQVEQEESPHGGL